MYFILCVVELVPNFDSLCSGIFLHASFRTRNLKNRVVNKMEQLGVKRSPMGLLMEMTGYEVQLRAEDLIDELKK